MKIIAIGDVHFRTDNIPEVQLFMDKIEILAKETMPDLIVVLGDVLHTHERLHTIPLNKAYEFIGRMRKIAKTIILVGNHDMCNNQQFLTDLHWMNGLKEWQDVEIIDTVKVKMVDGISLVFVPYVPPGRFLEALDTKKGEWENCDCIFAHQEFHGCKMGAIASVDGDVWPEDHPYVVSGHIHGRQFIQENIYYPGAAMQHAFGESDRNVIPILKWEKAGEKYSLEEVDLGLPRKKIVYTDVQSVEELQVPVGTEDKIKISITGGYDDFKAFKKTKKYRELVKTGTKVVFKPTKIKLEESEEPTEVSETDFEKILSSLILKEKNNFLYQVYELVVRGKETDSLKVFFKSFDHGVADG